MPAARAIALLTAGAMVLAGQPALAQPKPGGLPIIRDAEIEQLMRDYTAPILKVAGLGQQNVQVVLINERAFNAFVMDGRRIFINVGALYDSKTPNEIIGVLAHETGHMAGGHLSRLREQLANAQTASIIAHAARRRRHGRRRESRRRRQHRRRSRAAAIQAPQEMIRRSLLSYVRAQEESGRPRGGQVPQRDRPVRQGHAEYLQALRRRLHDHCDAASIPISSPIRCRASA